MGKAIGRPSGTLYATEFVRDISEQILVAFYNERASTLRDRIEKDPEWISKIRTKAQSFDSLVRVWLQVLDEVDLNTPKYRHELMFRVQVETLEPPMTRDYLDSHPEREAYLRNYFGRHLTEEQYRIYYSRFYDAIQRVRTDSCLKLIVPEMPVVEEDEFL